MNEKPMVYICSPLHADNAEEMNANMQKAQEYMKCISKRFKCRAVAPHAYIPMLLNDYTPEERELGLFFGKELLKLCKAMIVCGNRVSNGMRGEITLAKKLGIPVFYLSEEDNTPSIIRGCGNQFARGVLLEVKETQRLGDTSFYLSDLVERPRATIIVKIVGE